jgi:hypothetical protein
MVAVAPWRLFLPSLAVGFSGTLFSKLFLTLCSMCVCARVRRLDSPQGIHCLHLYRCRLPFKKKKKIPFAKFRCPPFLSLLTYFHEKHFIK